MVKDFPLSTLEKVAREAGVERVSSSSLKELRNILLEEASKIAVEAITACRHARRVTIKKEDVILASR